MGSSKQGAVSSHAARVPEIEDGRKIYDANGGEKFVPAPVFVVRLLVSCC